MIDWKKTGEGDIFLFLWLFFIFIIIGAGVAITVLIFYSAQADVRAEEADILVVRIIDCLVDEGYVREDFFGDFDVFKECGIYEDAIENGEDFYLNVKVSDSGSGKSLKEIENGVKDFRMQCSYKTGEKSLAECREKIVYALNKSAFSQEFTIEVFAASNQLGGNL